MTTPSYPPAVETAKEDPEMSEIEMIAAVKRAADAVPGRTAGVVAAEFIRATGVAQDEPAGRAALLDGRVGDHGTAAWMATYHVTDVIQQVAARAGLAAEAAVPWGDRGPIGQKARHGARRQLAEDFARRIAAVALP